MYIFAVGLRYLRARWLTLASVAFVACGVTALIVVESIMGGFQRELRAHLRGARAHVTVTCRSADAVDRLARRLGKRSDVVATAPRKRGLVLMVAHGDRVDGCQLIGVDAARERAASELPQYLVTPFEEVRQHLRKLARDSGYRCEWRLLGVAESPTRLVLAFRQPEREQKEGAKRRFFVEHQVFELDAQERVARIEVSVARERLPRPTGDAERWKPWVARHNALALSRDVEALLARYRSDLTFAVNVAVKVFPLDPARPFELAGGRVPQRHPGVLVGYTLYYQMKLRAGEEVVLVTAREGEQGREIVSRTFVVTGAIKAGLDELDSSTVLVERREAVGLLEPDSGNELALALTDVELADAVRDELQQTLGDQAIVETWRQGYGPLLAAAALQRKVMWVVLGMFVVFASATVAVILALTVVEKVRDIGVLRAIGATSGGVASIFVQGALAAGVMGCAVGVAVGVPLALRINALADWLYQTFDVRVFPADVYHLDRIPVDVQPASIGVTVAVTLVLCVIASLLPARAAARLSVVQALRWE